MKKDNRHLDRVEHFHGLVSLAALFTRRNHGAISANENISVEY
jgi:hypothetical protein